MSFTRFGPFFHNQSLWELPLQCFSLLANFGQLIADSLEFGRLGSEIIAYFIPLLRGAGRRRSLEDFNDIRGHIQSG